MTTYNTTARMVELIYLAGIVIGVGGNILIQSILGTPDYLSAISSNSMKLFTGVWLIIKGFNSSPIVLKSVKTDIIES